MEALCNSTDILLLNGWEASKGATAELHTARWLDLGVFYETEMGSLCIQDGKLIRNSEKLPTTPSWNPRYPTAYFPKQALRQVLYDQLSKDLRKIHTAEHTDLSTADKLKELQKN
jgi:hypothetical protein